MGSQPNRDKSKATKSAENMQDGDAEIKENKKRKEFSSKRKKSKATKNAENKQDGDAEIKKNTKPKEFAPYGNYRFYYGYRIGQDVEEDPRFKVLKKEWFEDKDCLDIGCNNGLITINIAKKFGCRSILGIDIDSNRIREAYWLLRKIVKIESAGNKHSKTSKEITDQTKDTAHSETLNCEEEVGKISRDCSSNERDLFDIVSFHEENFVTNHHRPAAKHYDTIICFSVTKWVHMNWGDDGLITLFAKIWRLLHPGGILLLEPQPWKSYGKNRRVSEVIAANYDNIELHPECFQEILLDKIGFRYVENISFHLAGSKTGFNRPVLAFRK